MASAVSKPEKFSSWNILCSDGIEHTITIERVANSGFPFKLYIDTQMVDTIKSTRKGCIVTAEHQFQCGGDRVLLVFYGGRLDLVHQGMLVKTNIKYNPDEKLPLYYSISLMALNILALSFFAFSNLGELSVQLSLFVSVILSLCNTILIWKNATSPFYTKKKKWLFTFLQALWGIGLVIFFSFSDVIYRIILN